MIPLSDDQLRAFAERGYIVIGNVIQRELINAAMLHIDGLVKQEPPPPDRRGYHFYWQDDLPPSDPLRSLLTDSRLGMSRRLLSSRFIWRCPRRLKSPSISHLGPTVPADLTSTV